MFSIDGADLAEAKQSLRQQVRQLRRGFPEKVQASSVILERLTGLDSFATRLAPLFYANTRFEVATTPLIERRLQAELPVWIPYCAGADLEVFRLRDWSELMPGAFGIPEPRPECRTDRATADGIDAVIVPGVAFDRSGGRLGNGKGYYDRFLRQWPDCLRIGLAFSCQIVDQVPRAAHDETLDYVLTEREVIACPPRPPGPGTPAPADEKERIGHCSLYRKE